MEAGYSDISHRALTNEELVDLYLAFTDAFSDYPIPFNLSLEDFSHKFISRLKIDLRYSAGVWKRDKLAGFILARRSGEIVYYGAVGIRKAFRGKHLMPGLIRYQESLIKELPVNQVCLEVLCQNTRALRIYESSGYSAIRKLFSYEGRPVNRRGSSLPGIKIAREIPWEEIADWFDIQPAFLNSKAVLDPGRSADMPWIYRDHQGMGALLVINPDNGRLSMLLVRPDLRRKGLGSQLVRFASEQSHQKLVLLNIPEKDIATRSLLETNGLQVFCEQMEMKKTL